jgi:formate dehydrogenase major subunit
MADSDCIVIMGNNMAETHPVGFRFVMAAKQRGAQVIHIDPRFTRTSALADMHVALRAGSDLVFLGALVRHVLESERWQSDPFFQEYVRTYTNAPVLLDPNFRDTEDLGGVFSGFDPDGRRYDTDTWQYAGRRTDPGAAARHPHQDTQTREGSAATGDPRTSTLDPSMQDPNCVLQVLRRHFARYTPDLVERACGVPRDVFLRIAETLLANSSRERTTCFAYAVAWTQHTTGSQIIGCCAVLQLLLGNIGRPGGGILALRGHATIQGSTDIPTLYDLLPGYIPMPTLPGHTSLATFLRSEQLETGLWYHLPDYLVSLLKAWYGDAATVENDFAFNLVPKIGGDYSFEAMAPMMLDGTMRGLFCLGQNPAVGGQNAVAVRKGLANLDWLVVRDAHEIETASFWYAAPEVRAGKVRSTDIGTEVFFLPAALTPEKDGSYTNTQRLVQFHDKAVEPPGDCRSEAWFVYHLGRRLRELYANEDGPAARQNQSLTWDYPTRGPTHEPDVAVIVKEINGYTVADQKAVPHFSALRADGTTACGCWIYSGILTPEGENRARRRRADAVAPSGHASAALDWGFAWPSNVRLLYNRASADPQGRPWSERKKWVWWDAERGEWTGYDVPDFPRTKAPDYAPPPDARGMDAHSGSAPFVRLADGRGALFTGPSMRDGPLPTHYEPWESPIVNPLYPRQPRNPLAVTFDRPENRYHASPDPRFPYVLTTYRLTEHHTAGGMSRWVPWLAELQPAGFVEISPELADALQIEHGDWVTVSTLRGETDARAMVTERLQPLDLNGTAVHQVGMPWHFGYGGLARGGVANDLSALIEDPNSRIHEAKSFTCNVRKGRLRLHQEANA